MSKKTPTKDYQSVQSNANKGSKGTNMAYDKGQGNNERI